MGDKNAPQVFNRSYWEGLGTWLDQTKEHSITAENLEGDKVEVSLSTFADDLQRTIQANHETIYKDITDINAKLDKVLEEGGGYKQNRDTLVLQPTFVGIGSHEHYRKFRENTPSVPVARCLGNLLHNNCC